MITPVSIGYKLPNNCACLVLVYQSDTGNLRQRSMPLRNLANLDDTIIAKQMKDKHLQYLKDVDEGQLVSVINKAMVALSGNAEAINLNKLDDKELGAHKLKMDVLFNKNKKTKNDKGFVYDVQKDFKDPKEESGWDSD
eukprot:m.62099 g.62099  ORF g.62099 m.62099 type:complete len:139 (-) comp11485_c1_seq1:14-430(-)